MEQQQIEIILDQITQVINLRQLEFLFGQQFKNDDVTFSGYSYGFTGTDTDYKNNYGESKKTYSAHASLFRQVDKEDFGLNLISGIYVSKTESERNVKVDFGTSVNDKYLSDYWDLV